MSYDEDYKLNTQAEQYLQDNEGNLGKFYTSIGMEIPFRMSFCNALATPDLVRLRMNGRLASLREPTADDKPDDDVVLEAIEFLKSTRGDYPESHPIWHTR